MHIGQLYELTGSRSFNCSEAIAEIAKATRRTIRYEPVSVEQYAADAATQGVAPEVITLLSHLFGTVLDGRNAHVADGVQRALGRRPRDFTSYVLDTAATGVWSIEKGRAGVVIGCYG